MTDADLRALFDAWLRDRAQVHKLANLSGAVLRAYTEAVTAAAVRTAYPPQIRAQSPAEAPPAADEGSAGPGGPAEGRGGSTGVGLVCAFGGSFHVCMQGCGEVGFCKRTRAPAITHADGSPLRHCQDDFGRRHAARLDRREAWERGPIIPRHTMLDGRGDAAPRNPEDQGDGA